MASYTTNLKDWGATGSEYPDGYNYLEGEQPVDDWDNFLINNVVSDVKDHLIPLTNSRIEADYGASGGEPATPEKSHLYHDQDGERLELWDDTDSVWRGLMFRDGDTMTGALDMGNYPIEGASLLDLTANNADLRLATGQAIEDGSGTTRYEIQSDKTVMRGDGGDVMFLAGSSSETRIDVRDTQLRVRDNVGGFDAFKYSVSSSAPGTLELTNADLDAGGNDITNVGSVNTGQGAITGLSFGSRSTKTISGGSVSVSQSETVLEINGEGSTADELATISGGQAWQLVVVTRGSDDITVLDTTDANGGNIVLQGGSNQLINDSNDRLVLMANSDASFWQQLAVMTR